MEDRLCDLKKGEQAVVVGIADGCDMVVRQRLLDLGFVEGANIVVSMKAPYNDPVAYYIHQTQIAIRKEDAANVLIEKKEI